MTILDIAALDRRQATGTEHALADARRRLLAAAEALETKRTDERLLRATAAELDAIVHRIRWAADIAADDRLVNG